MASAIGRLKPESAIGQVRPTTTTNGRNLEILMNDLQDSKKKHRWLYGMLGPWKLVNGL